MSIAKEGLWEQAGDIVTDVIAGIANINERIAEDICDYLSEEHGGYAAILDGGDDPYSNLAQYEEAAPNVLGFLEKWDSFLREIKSHARFYNTKSNEILKELFGDLSSLRTHYGSPVIQEILPHEHGSDICSPIIYWARIAFSETEIEAMLINPVKELSAPPSHIARAGRMNAESHSPRSVSRHRIEKSEEDDGLY
jgi:hypothetical protein